MLSGRKGKARSIILLVFCLVLLQTSTAAAISRGEVVYEIMSALELPLVQGDSGFVDVSKLTLHGESIQAAKALGILPPFEHFHPTLEAANAEAVMFAVRALGLFNEAEILSSICEFEGDKSGVPLHLMPYMAIASEMTPKAPDEFLSNPRDNVTRSGLNSLVAWLKNCKNGLIFEKTLRDDIVTVTMHREGIGRPPKLWLVLVDEIPLDAEAKARDLSGYLKNLGLPAFVVRQEWAFQVTIGPFANYIKAYEVLTSLPKHLTASIVPYGAAEESPALFWVALAFDAARVTPKIALSSTEYGTSNPLSEMAREKNARAAVNGGYFSGVKPIGLVMMDGKVVYTPYSGRTAIGWDDSGKIFIGQVRAKVKVKVGTSAEFHVEGVNVAPTYHGITIYTPEFGPEARGLQSDALEVMVRGGKITWKQGAGTAAHHYIPRDGFLLVARGNSRQFFANVVLGTDVEVISTLEPQEFNHAKWAFQAGPLLLTNGMDVNVNEGFKPSFTDKRHPRTLWGSDGSKVYWVVVDGRDPWHSRGVTLHELRSVAKRLGIKDAVNLDGGGSSALWWKGVLINHSPGGRERPLPYIIYLD